MSSHSRTNMKSRARGRSDPGNIVKERVKAEEGGQSRKPRREEPSWAMPYCCGPIGRSRRAAREMPLRRDPNITAAIITA